MKSKKIAKMLCLAMTVSSMSACSVEQSAKDLIAEQTGIDVDQVQNTVQTVTQTAQEIQAIATQGAQTAQEGLQTAQEMADEASEFFENLDQPANSDFAGKGDFNVHFIDVGQGDAILLEYTEDGKAEYALIDAGDNDKGTTVQKYLKDHNVDQLKYLILTHPDADHIGGADVIITKFDIDQIYMSGVAKDTKTYRDVIDAIRYKNYKSETPGVGTTFTLGAAELEVLAAPTDYEDVNNDSIVVKAVYGNSSFLFMGDAEFEEEEELLERFAKADDTLDVDVLKAGHHGSYTSSSNEFIAKVTPDWTVISCGFGNQYGHPHNTSLYNFADYESDLFRTDIQGTIICSTNGVGFIWNKDDTQNWKSGEELTEDDIEYEY